MNTITIREVEELISNCSMHLVNRLMNSDFFTPIKRQKGALFINTVHDDENIFIRLFDTKEMYERVETDISPVKLPFDIVFDMIGDKIDGFILYLGSREFILDERFVKRNLAPYTAQELKSLTDNTDSQNKPFAESVFLTLLLSDDDLSNQSEDGIISHALDMRFEMATIEISEKHYHLLFTSKEHLKSAYGLFPDTCRYCQIIDLAELVRDFESSKIDGVLIDFPDKLKLMTTEELKNLNIKNNVKLMYSLNYIFEVE